jgi:hypothetical protein
VKIIRHYLFTGIRHWLIVRPSRRSSLNRPSRIEPLFNNQPQQINRPHCLYRRPAIRQPRKAAHDRDDPVRLIESERLKPLSPVGTKDPASNAPRESQRQKGETSIRISAPDSLGWERRTSCTLPHFPGQTSCSVHVVGTCDPWRTDAD